MNNATPNRRSHWMPLVLALGIVILPLLVSWMSLTPRVAAQQRPAGDAPSIYLPLIVGRPTSTEPSPTPAPGNRVSGALYFEKERKTASASVAIDARGGMHAALVDSVPYVEHPAAMYRYCPGPAAGCANPANWQSVRLYDQVDEVQLALTPAGQPRLLIQARGQHEGGTGKDYLYAACDAECNKPDRWSITLVTYTLYTEIYDIGDYRNPQRYFALDPRGRPGFVFKDRNYFIEPDHIGVFYATCAGACANSASWSITPIGSAEEQDFTLTFERPSLAFTSQGRPRIAAHISVSGDRESGISYIGCDADCDVGASWKRVLLYPRGQGIDIGWDIALDPQDRPRIAAFPDSLSDGSGEQLYYFWCNSATMDGCLNAETSWFGTNLGLGTNNGQQPDLEIDAQGRPRIAWLSSLGSLGYTWCTTGCESAQPQWKYEVVETYNAMEAANPKAIPLNCDQDAWEGLTPVLALDAAGNPRIAYDVSVEARCLYTDPTNPNNPPTTKFGQIWRGVRLVFFPQS